MKSEVKKYFEGLEKWQPELTKLRNIILGCGLKEELKWKHPCYTFNGKNVVLIHEFKDHCAITFFKGALLKDSEKLLIQPTKNIQAERLIRFLSKEEILSRKRTIMSYIDEAIEIEKSGLKVKMKDTSDYETPEELSKRFMANPDFKEAFDSLTPGRQRGYLLYFSQAKQIKTRESRISKNMDRIFMGKGLNDCICGLSKRMPRCDGSHKDLMP